MENNNSNIYSVRQFTENVNNLTTKEKQKLFQLLTKNAELINKVIPDLPILVHILNDDIDLSGPVIDEYKEWKNK